MHSHRVGSDLEARLGGEELRHPRLEIGTRAAVVDLRGVQRELSRGLYFRRHRCEQVTDRLMLPDLLAERFALLRIANGVVDGRLRDADGAGGDLDTAELEAAHHLREALSLLATEKRVGGRAVPV